MSFLSSRTKSGKPLPPPDQRNWVTPVVLLAMLLLDVPCICTRLVLDD
jgi:hypothetical protein